MDRHRTWLMAVIADRWLSLFGRTRKVLLGDSVNGAGPRDFRRPSLGRTHGLSMSILGSYPQRQVGSRACEAVVLIAPTNCSPACMKGVGSASRLKSRHLHSTPRAIQESPALKTAPAAALAHLVRALMCETVHALGCQRKSRLALTV